jgi:hypothetical protein
MVCCSCTWYDLAHKIVPPPRVDGGELLSIRLKTELAYLVYPFSLGGAGLPLSYEKCLYILDIYNGLILICEVS